MATDLTRRGAEKLSLLIQEKKHILTGGEHSAPPGLLETSNHFRGHVIVQFRCTLGIRTNALAAPWFGAALDERDQTALTRFLRGHLMSLTFVDGIKYFETCTKCSSAQAYPGHILSCLGLTRQDLVQDPLLVLDFIRVNGLVDLI
ncbi:uncharacterized protein TNCV_957751 [Trichonephila clavipes]|nr:uncharacterized protein TNCV_957751 [Trichonephila clavipes]